MPTIYSDCIDCVDLSHLAHLISNETHEKNVVLFKELQKEHKDQKCIEIIKKMNTASYCSICKETLCPDHSKRAYKYHQYYRYFEGFLCDRCCWNEIG